MPQRLVMLALALAMADRVSSDYVLVLVLVSTSLSATTGRPRGISHGRVHLLDLTREVRLGGQDDDSGVGTHGSVP